ncbi:MAG: hypothetical protein LBT00_13200, partial [Spirochaetaceae bacterium]|nr:hypothetical protein [Spirochaetaceae bacterium]
VAFAAGSRIETGVNGYAQFDYGFKTPATENTTVTLSGDVRIAADKTIGFGHASGTVTLTEGTTVSLSGGSPVLVLTAPATAGLKLSGTTTSVVTVKAGGEVDVSTEDVTFTGDVAFGGNLTLTDKGVTFDGTAFFAPDAVITLTAADDSAITLKDGHALAIGAPTNTAAVWQYFLTASGADVTLTPAANTKLTVAADGKTITQDTSTSGAHGITVGGEAVLVSGSTYKVASESGKVGTLTLDSGAVLTLGPETILPEGYEDKAPPQIVLTGAASGGAVLTGEGTLIAGGTEITGGNTDGTWTASGAAGLVTIAEDSITGDAAGVTLTAGGHANAEIKVTNATLTADGVAITVVSDPYGKVTLVGSATDGDQGKLLLKGGANPGTLVADSSKTSATVTSETAITLQNGSSSAGTDAAVSGTIPGILIKVASEQNPTTAVELGSIGGGTSANQDALITAPSTAVDSVIKTGSYVKAGS